MTHRGQETGFRFVGSFSGALGFGQRLVELGQLVSTCGYPLLKAFIDAFEGVFGSAELGDVGETHDEAAARHRVANQLDHLPIGKQPLRGVSAALAHPVQTPRNVNLCLARPAESALGVVTDDVGNRPANADQAFRVIEQLKVATIPGHQPQGLVDHADALGNVFDGPLQQRAVELQDFGGFVGDAYDVFQLHVATFDSSLDHRAGRRGAEHAGQQSLGMRDPFTVGIQAGVETLTLPLGEADETLPRAVLTDEACRQAEQVLDLYREQRAAEVASLGFLTDETTRLPVLGHSRARQHRHPGEQRAVAGHRQHHALGHRRDRQVERVAVQPGEQWESAQRPAHAMRRHRQHEGVEPNEDTGRQACKYTTPIGLLPVQRTEHGGSQLGDRGKGDLADGRQTGRRPEHPVADVGQQKNHHDADASDGKHPVTKRFERPFGVFAS